MESINHQGGRIDRRRFIRLGAYLTILPLLGLNQIACSSSAPAEVTDWHLMSETGDGNGKLIIDRVEGEAVVDGTPLTPGMQIPRDKSIDVRSGVVLVSLPDQSIIKLSHNALLTAVLDSQKGGILQLQRGGLLAVVRKSAAKPYLVRNAAALVGIKGTVFYTQVLSVADKASNSLPQTATDYFCICNGEIDILTADFSKIHSDSAVHHNAYFFMPQNKDLAIKRVNFLLNHSDGEISELINRMKGAKHHTDWLFPKKSNYLD